MRIREGFLVLALGFGSPRAQTGAVPPRPAQPCFPDAGTPAGAAITVSAVPSRVSGVAPLAVFFDASGTTATSTGRPFHELAYCWDFGDSTAGAFAVTGVPKNRAYGPVAGHVFETPGLFTVVLRIRDSTGREASRSMQISVRDPDSAFAGTKTVCFANAADFAGCPAGAQQVPDAIKLSALQSHVAPGKRLLLRRGDVFSGNRLNLKKAGPSAIGAFGSCARPKILPGNAPAFAVTDPDTALVFDDWRIVDIEVDGEQNADSRFDEIGVKSSNLLILRCRTINAGGAYAFTGPSIIDYWNNNGDPGQDVIDVAFVQESEAADVAGGQGHNLAGGAGHRVVFQGNVFRNSTGGEHIMRTFWIDRGVIGNNDFSMAPAPRHLLKFHAPGFNNSASIGYQKYTERVVISDNVFHGDGGHQWSVALGPQNQDSDERVRDLLVERNFFTAGPAVQVALMVWAQDATLRNNVFDRGANVNCVGVERRGIEPAPARVALLHNTCLGSGSSIHLAAIGGQYPGIVAANNLIVGPGAAVGTAGDTSRYSVLSHNAAFATPAAAGLAAPVPAAWADFRLVSGSPAIDAGAPVSATYSDFEGRYRGTAPDAGAFEFSAAAPILFRSRIGPGLSPWRARPGTGLFLEGDDYFDARGRIRGMHPPEGAK